MTARHPLMQHASDHDHPHIYGRENGNLVPIDTSHPADTMEPLPATETSAERLAMMNGIKWAVELFTPSRPSTSPRQDPERTVIARVFAFRYLLRMDGRSLEEMGNPYGISRQMIDQWVEKLSDRFGIPRQREAARKVYAKAQRESWKGRAARSRVLPAAHPPQVWRRADNS